MNIIESIGRTPLVELNKITSKDGARIFLKSSSSTRLPVLRTELEQR